MKNVADIYALSPMQELMLLHAKTARTEQDVLLTQVVYALDGPLDAAAYRQAWQLMVERHPALRTLFVWQDDKPPIQVVRTEVTLPWRDADWSNVPVAEHDAKLDGLLAADRAEGMDLMRPPAMRLTLIRLNADRHWLIWSTHHLVLDRWCTGILFDEIRQAYGAFTSDAFPALPPAPGYREYIEWLAQQDETAAAAYWQNALRDHRARPLAVGPHLPGEAEDVQHCIIELNSRTWTALRRMAADNDVTWGTCVLGAWALVLGAATHADDALFGVTVSGRPSDLPGAGQTIGSFINNVPFRVELDPDQPLLVWLQRIQDHQLELDRFDFASPTQIQAWTGQSGAGPLFDSLIVVQAAEELAAPDPLHIGLLRGETRSAYPVTVSVQPGAETLRIVVAWKQELVPAALARQLPVALEQILSALVDGPRTSVAALLALAGDGMPDPMAADVPRPQPVEPKHAPWARTPMEHMVARVWAEVLGHAEIPADGGYFDVGGNSLNATRLLTALETRTGRRLSLNALLKNPTMADMAEELGELSAEETDPVLQIVAPGGERLPFFYMHGVFGDLLSLSNLAPLLDPELPVYGLEAVGLRPGHPPDVSIEEMAVRYATSIRRVQPQGPYLLGGYCFGGVIAYEVARRLRAQGAQVALLAIIEGAAPTPHHRGQPLIHPERVRALRHTVPYWVRDRRTLAARVQRRWTRSPMAGERVDDTGADQWPGAGAAGLDGEEMLNFVDFNASRPQIQNDLRDVSYAAMMAYTPEPYPGHVTLYRASALSFSHALGGAVDTTRGWGALAEEGVSVRYVDGSHSTMLLMPHAKSLAQALSRDLARAQESTA